MLLAAVLAASLASDEGGVNLFQRAVHSRHHHHNTHRHRQKKHHKKHHKSNGHVHQRPVESILAVQSEDLGNQSVWQYHGQSINDWEKDLIADDDDMLVETMQRHSKDANVKGSVIVPTPQGNSEFNNDYPKDDNTTLKRQKQTQNATTASLDVPKGIDVTPSVSPNQTDEGRAEPFNKKVDESANILEAKADKADKALKNSRAKADKAHASVHSKQTAVQKQNESIAERQDELYEAGGRFLKCHKLERKLEMDVLMTKQAKAALLARLDMLQKQKAANVIKLRAANDTIAKQKALRKAAKKQLEKVLKEERKMQKNEKVAGAALQNATDIFDERNQELTTAIVAANNTVSLVRRDKQGLEHLPDLVELEFRLGQINKDLESAILYQGGQDSAFRHQEFQPQHRRRRREGKVVQSVLAMEAHKRSHHEKKDTKKADTYPALQSEADWEKDLVTDDDDQLSKTFKVYAKDPSIKGTIIAPQLQTKEDFAHDYPIDNAGDQAEEARHQRAQQAAQEKVRVAQQAASKAQRVVETKRTHFQKTAKETAKAKAETKVWQRKYSNATQELHAVKADVKRNLANQTKLQDIKKEISQKIKRAENAKMELELKLSRQSVDCKKLQDAVSKLNATLLKEEADLEGDMGKLKELQKHAKQADKEVEDSEKALQDAEEALEKAEATTESEQFQEEKPTKSCAAEIYILPAIPLAFIVSITGSGRAW